MAETTAPYFYKERNEKRILIKQPFYTPPDITTNKEEQTHAITVASLSAPRYNELIKKLCEVLNETELIFSGTTLRLIYKNYED